MRDPALVDESVFRRLIDRGSGFLRRMSATLADLFTGYLLAWANLWRRGGRF